MIFALIPAGGKSRRMGRPKLLLPAGDGTVLERVIRTLRAELASILVVVSPHVPQLKPLAVAAGAHVCLLAEETAAMRVTVEHGLRWLEDHFRPSENDSWLLVPADHPTLEAATVRQLIQAQQARPGFSIVAPTFQGKRGHPVLIGWKHVAALRAWPVEEGLNTFLRCQAKETLEVPMTTAAILDDLDTPEDYERLRHQWEKPFEEGRGTQNP